MSKKLKFIDMLIIKAKYFGINCNLANSTFNYSIGWLDKFKKRHNIIT